MTAAVIETRRLGRSEVTVPRIALGCGNFGGVGSSVEWFGRGLDEAAAFAIMDAAWDLGINHFDTADAYGGGRSEATIGAWIRSRGHLPLLTTKTYNPMAAGADHGLAPERMERQLHSSLERLGVPRVDLYLTHEFDPDVAPELVVAALDGFREEGLIGAAGVSNYDAAQLALTLDAGRVDAIQNSYSLLERRDEAALLRLCAREQVAYTVYSPLAGGWLTGKYRRGEPYPAGSRMTQRPDVYSDLVEDRVFDALEGLERLAAELDTSMAGLSLGWLLANPDVTAVVIGPGRPDQLDVVAQALARPLGALERERVSELFA